MTISSAQLQLIMTVKETLAVGVPAVTNKTLTHDAYNVRTVLTPTTTVPVTKIAFFSQALTAGAVTLNLASIVGADGTLDLTGLKVQGFMLINGTVSSGTVSAGSNAAMTFTFGAANPYNIFGATGIVTLLAGSSLLLINQDSAPDVAAGARTIDVTGTTTQAFLIGILAG